MPETKFPLIVWEHTKEAEKSLQEAVEYYKKIRDKLTARGFQCTFMGNLRHDKNCEHEIWINSCMPLNVNRLVKKSEDALQYSLKYGISGWYTLTELDAFLRGMGIIMSDAMWELGYRKSMAGKALWTRKTPKEKKQSNPMHTIRWNDRNKPEFFRPDKEERARLENMFIPENQNSGLNKTYTLSVCKVGMIYSELNVNPFSASRTEDIGKLSDMLENRGHIAKKQEGFYLESRNVRLKGEEKIYIKAVKPDKTLTEIIWPTLMPAGKIYDLADELVHKVVRN